MIGLRAFLKINVNLGSQSWASFSFRFSHIARYAPSPQEKNMLQDCGITGNLKRNIGLKYLTCCMYCVKNYFLYVCLLLKSIRGAVT